MSGNGDGAGGFLDLLDWKRCIFSLYAQVREASDQRAAWQAWRAGRDALFASHPSSPLPQRARTAFGGLDYFDYDPALCVSGEVVAAERETRRIAGSGNEPVAFTRFARARFTIAGLALDHSGRVRLRVLVADPPAAPIETSWLTL